MNLSQHFKLAEFEVTEHRNIDNSAPDDILPNLKRTSFLMEDVRALFGVPIFITSGYRCSALNKAVGSKPTSQHVQGLACDFSVPAYGDPLAVCKAVMESNIIFGKLILEYYTPNGGGWTHIQVGTAKEIFTINTHGTFAGLKP